MRKYIFSLLALASIAAMAEAPAAYYQSCIGKSGASLLSQLCSVVGNHTNVGYDGLYEVYKTSDVYPDGSIWDMYSTKHWSFSSKCGNYSSVGDCYNREHSLPKSWFKEASPMKSDAFHVYPTDGKVNGQRSNYPYGECSGGTTLSAPSGIKALGRLGTSTFSGYSGKVFEPADEYKGDFARTYFYMAAAYNDKIKGWNSDMLAQNSYPVFNSWAINLLLKWHRQDPVSQKEIERNEAVYAHQNNRNPFIDHPELAEHIWGDKSTTAWSGSDQSEPVISLPVDNSTIDFGTTATGYSVSRSISIKTINLTEPISLSVSNGSFTLSTSSVTARNANAGTSVSVTGKATTAGTTTATLTLKSGDLKTTVTLSLKALDGLPALEATNVTGESFTARWVDLGTDNTLSLQVMKDGTCIDGYPVTVNSALGEYDVDNLEPLTTYTYRLLSSSLTSNTITVTTAELLPSAQVIYDGDIILSASPGVASDPVELYLDIEHIEGNITLSVPKPFQLSINHLDWDNTLVILPGEDRFYLRVLSDSEGEFDGTINISVGDYVNDDTDIFAVVADNSIPRFFEDFEVEGIHSACPAYSTGNFKGNATTWAVTEAGFRKTDATHNGDAALCLSRKSTSSLTSTEPKKGGIGSISFYARKWNANEADATIAVETSPDNYNWTNHGNVTVDKDSYNCYTVTPKVAGDRYIRLRQTAGARALIDDIEATHYTTTVEYIDVDYTWDAYAQSGALIIANNGDSPRHFLVYDVEGRVLANRDCLPGVTTLTLPAGLYIVATDSTARRVVVR